MRLTSQTEFHDALVTGYTAGQGGALVIYVVSLLLWVFTEFTYRSSAEYAALFAADDDVESGKGDKKAAPPVEEKKPAIKYRSLVDEVAQSNVVRCLMVDKAALLAARTTLRAIVEIGTILLWFYIADRTRITGESDKDYSRDVFLFIFLAMTAVGASYSLKKARAPTVLNRNQTEEWKGWMQVLFLMYHYFEAVEYYNAIRVFIAGYVWMTGFGNFMYYYKTNDYSIGRFAQMMWRLNFLVIVCCVVLRNDYMLYYICPMHTLFTLFVFATLAIVPSVNKNLMFMGLKIAVATILVAIVWETPGVFHTLWRPFGPLVNYIDPRKGEQDPLHEWYFRSGLDRYVWIFGMLCGWVQPTFSKFVSALDSSPNRIRTWCIQFGVLIGSVGVLYLWYTNIFTLHKYEYNKYHPFTSWIPITGWIFIRNLTEGLRGWSIGIFQWCGCITLETYISQFHTWLSSAVPNGQPKYLLELISGYPLVNFGVVSTLYVAISKRLFDITNTLRDAFIPHDDDRKLALNLSLMTAVGMAAYGAALVVMASTGLLE